MKLVGVAYNGNDALKLIYQESPDIVLLDIIMPHLDGLGVLETLQKAERRPHVIILSALGQESMLRQAARLGADYYILKPFELDTLGKRIRQLYTEAPSISSLWHSEMDGTIVQMDDDSQETSNWEIEVTDMLHQLGIPAHIKGYLYLREAIINVAQEVSLLDAVTKELYPKIAKKYEVNPDRVERRIQSRH